MRIGYDHRSSREEFQIRLAPLTAKCSVSMAFQNDPHVFADSPAIRAGQLNQIVIKRFRQVQLHITGALARASQPQRRITQNHRFRHGRSLQPLDTTRVEGGVASTTGISRLGLFAHSRTVPYLAPIDHALGWHSETTRVGTSKMDVPT